MHEVRQDDELAPLVPAVLAGSRQAAQRLARALLPRARNLVRYLLRGDSDVDDVAQDALVAVFRGLSTYRGEGSVRSWADRIVVRTALARVRRARIDLSRHERHLEPVSVASPVLQSRYLALRQAVRLLDALPDDQRRVLVMHHVLGLGMREIAKELSVPLETVRSRARLGMARLRESVLPTRELEQVVLRPL